MDLNSIDKPNTPRVAEEPPEFQREDLFDELHPTEDRAVRLRLAHLIGASAASCTISIAIVPYRAAGDAS